MGKPIIMGRKTFESIGKALPGRMNIVITRNKSWHHEGTTAVNSLDAAIKKAGAAAHIDGVDELMIIGGEQIYREAVVQADRLYLTQVKAEVKGDAYFPEINIDHWREIAREDFLASENNPYDYSFAVFDRRHSDA